MLIGKSIRFDAFDANDTKKYMSYLRTTGMDISSDLYPHVLMAHRDILNIERGYTGDVCWHRDLYKGEEFWYMPVGKMDDIKSFFNRYVPKGTEFAALPETMKIVLEKLLGKHIYFEPQPELDDYIVDNHKLVSMSGREYKGLRSHYNKISRENVISVCDLRDVSTDELQEFNKAAIEQMDENNEGVYQEKLLSKYLLDALGSEDSLFGTVLKINGEIKGFTINEKGISNECIGIYMKTDHSIKGLGEFISVVDAKRQMNQGFSYCNIMADEGEAKLRESKLGYRPVRMIKKYYARYY